jgi:hypothetical protein
MHKEGDFVSITKYGTIVKTFKERGGEVMQIKGSDGHVFDVKGDKLAEDLVNGSDFNEVVKTNLTEMATILSNSNGAPFTVEFLKKDGTLRSLRGILVRPEPVLGRCIVIDVDETIQAGTNQFRQVDNRTIKSLIIRGVKYDL